MRKYIFDISVYKQLLSLMFTQSSTHNIKKSLIVQSIYTCSMRSTSIRRGNHKLRRSMYLNISSQNDVFLEETTTHLFQMIRNRNVSIHLHTSTIIQKREHFYFSTTKRMIESDIERSSQRMRYIRNIYSEYFAGAMRSSRYDIDMDIWTLRNDKISQ